VFVQTSVQTYGPPNAVPIYSGAAHWWGDVPGAKALIAPHGHEVDTVADEDLTGAEDTIVIDACRADQRMLLTFDVGFGFAADETRRNRVSAGTVRGPGWDRTSDRGIMSPLL
jgi:hypothetical protein